MKLSEIKDTRELSLEELVDQLETVRQKAKNLKEAAWYLEKAVIEGMRARGATVVKTPQGTATLESKVSYDPNILARLREITSPDDLVGYTAQREIVKVEPEKWNMTKAKALGKLSHDHQAIIDDARIDGVPTIKFKRSEGDQQL